MRLAWGYETHRVLAAPTVPTLTHTVLTIRGAEVDLLLEHVETLVALQVDRSAAAAVATGRAHLWLILLPPKSDASIASVACGDEDFAPVKEEPVRIALVSREHRVHRVLRLELLEGLLLDVVLVFKVLGGGGVDHRGRESAREGERWAAVAEQGECWRVQTLH